MPSWKGKTRGGVSGYKLFVAILKYPGLPLAYFFLRFVVVYFCFFSPKAFKSSFFYWNKIQKLTFFHSLLKIYKNFYVFGQVLLDKVVILAGYRSKFTFDFEGEKYLQQIVNNNKGGLLISAHIGNFEMAGQLLNRISAKINVVMLDAEHQMIKKYLSNVVQAKSINIIAVKSNMSHIFEINSAIIRREIVCLHGDRFVKGSKTVKCNFMGQPALFPTGPLYLAAKFNVPVSFVFAMKDSSKHYHFYASPVRNFIYPANFKNRDQELKLMVQEYVKELEMIVKKYPEQWFNFYNFWKDE